MLGTDRSKKILFLTGTRAEFGKMKSLMEKVKNSNEFECRLFVTGMHMLARYGSTFDEIHKAGFEQAFLYINQDGSVNSQMDLVLANTITGLGLYVREFPPDLIVVHGDRVEALAGAIVGALNNIFVAHVEGGEVSGTVDELLRHSISKLSHFHFVYNETAKNRLLQMGERPETVFVIGSPSLDIMMSETLPTLEEVRARYEIPFERYAIFIYHSVTTELHLLSQHIDQVLSAVEASSLNYVAIYPNNDAGGNEIYDTLHRLKGNPRFRILPSMRFEHYLTLLKHAVALVGNSSSGIHEAPLYGIPTINIGTRQLNRSQHPSIIHVPEEKEAILQVLDRLPKGSPPLPMVGKGNSAQAFVEHLRHPSFWATPHQKQFRDLNRES